MAETGSSQAAPNPPAPSESVAAADGGGEGAGSRTRTGRKQGALTVSIPVVSTPELSELLAGAAASPIVAVPVVAMPCIIAPAGLGDCSSVGFTGQFAMTDQAVLATVTAQAQAQMQLQAGYTQTSDPYKPTISAPFNTTPMRQNSPVKLEENIISPKPQELSPSDQKPRSPHIVVKTTSSDGYNWRKYGQKQVKSSENSRSYFRCSYANCFAKKKVEHCQDGRVIEVIYRGQHNHSPPQKTKYSKQRSCESNGPVVGKTNLNNLRTEFNALDSCTSNKENDTCNEVPEQLHCSSDCEGDPGVNTEEDNGDEPDSKRRLCENSITISAPSFKTVREPKVVVQAACELGKVSDGYRWRKYGQKIVKGNPNPRSYYKCTNIGCPVRKHVEKALGDSKFVIITYEGQHNHDLPPCRNGNETSTSAQATKIAVDARAAVMTSDEQMQAPGSLLDERTPTECTSDKNGESAVKKAVELGGEMALESAETLLSIGCNITAEDNGKANNPDVVQRPLFNQACSAVSVQNA